MAQLSPQRCLNRQSIYPSNSNQISFMSQLKLSEVYSILQNHLPTCQTCKLKQRNHYCMEPQCQSKSLLCINCDIKSINGKHYLHDFTFIAPLFSTSVFQSFYQLKQNSRLFQDCVSSQINKIYQYLQKLFKIQEISAKQIEKLELRKITGRFQQFENQLKKFVQEIRMKMYDFQGDHVPIKSSIQDIFKNVNFISQEDSLLIEEKMKTELMDQINKLDWLENPQKTLSQMLKKNQILNNINNPYDHQSDVFVSSRKKISITQIDNFFRNYNELFTQNLRHHKVEVKIESELLSKPKFYEAFIYHFKQCERLIIDNANMSYLRTPLNFRKLKELQFNCNVETDSFPNSRVQVQNDELESFTIRKFRQQDIKILKLITGPCKKLKNLHLEFFNKTDLSCSRDLAQYLTQQSEKDLGQFTLKVRTQSEVKRLYGYLSKFNQYLGSKVDLKDTIIELLKKNSNLKSVQIDGVKGLGSIQILRILYEMRFLLRYRITYQNIDLMGELDHEMNRILALKIERRNRVLASLTEMVKQKSYPNQIIKTIGGQFLV